ncbi:DUF937 domain-containing protein [Lysobacter korlensis]|uniref:DUF937 domain-containing protein n=1 Tax=Lysobacter korlensis TaxID=553636 RepID=A0ABV6RYN9_9GAMM
MPALDDLFDQIPVGDIAKRLGVEEDVARAAVHKAVPGLVSGIKANADDPNGAQSLEKALGKHRDRPVSRRSVDEIDTDDGDRIVSNVFGERRSQVTQTLADAEPKADSGLIAKVLPMIAPIVMAWLAKQAGGGGGLGGMLGGLLGGGGAKSGGAGSGLPGGLGDALGGLLGGGKR